MNDENLITALIFAVIFAVVFVGGWILFSSDSLTEKNACSRREPPCEKFCQQDKKIDMLSSKIDKLIQNNKS